MVRHDDPLALFCPVVAGWFRTRLGEPTAVQRALWPRIAAGDHVLATAPTGSGKTLAAFLYALDRLIIGALPGGAVRVLYVSPLKALNTDIRANLVQPLEELEACFVSAGESACEVRVLTRSGDTPAEERQRMARRPPEILITTPESLNILLTSRRGRAMLSGLTMVILDEVHAVAGSKRGVHLVTAVERLVPLAGEVQRVALSATVRPLQTMARWVGGYRRVDGGTGEPVLRPRSVTVVDTGERKDYDLEVRFPRAALEADQEADTQPGRLWDLVADEVRQRVRRNRSTLVFANSRRVVEKLTRLVNSEEADEVVYSHHGSLSREVRQVVEGRLKAGELGGIVATSSLELGIDIGRLDEVVLVQSPPTLAAATQRIGRAGHGVGARSRACFLPLFGRDLLAAAVVARGVLDGELEELRPVAGALDVLAQVIVSMTATRSWDIEELFGLLRCAEPYHHLPRRQLDLVLDMLAGRFAATGVRGLDPRVGVDRVSGTVHARPGAERAVYAAGGTIPDRGYFRVRREDTGAVLGELDEEFVWERSVGDTFSLGVQSWRVAAITANDVLVRPSRGSAAMAPFWRADEHDRSFAMAERTLDLLERAEACLEDAALWARLAAEHCLDDTAAKALRELLRRQRSATGKLPHRHRIIAERVLEPQVRGERETLLLHTLWGGRVNRPLALALQGAWEEAFGTPLEVTHDDDSLLLAVPPGTRAGELLELVRPERLEGLLRARLESTGYFGSRFRVAAAVALLLPREGFGRRTPLWLQRQRAKELLATVRRAEDFPILLETWRTCLQDELEMTTLARLLEELHDGGIVLHEATTDHPSPFAAQVGWRRTNELMYEDDASDTGPSRLSRDLVREVAFAAHLRPRLAPSLIETFRRKLQRVAPAWAPRPGLELVDWVEERGLLSLPEWRELIAAVVRDHGEGSPEDRALLRSRVVAVQVSGAPAVLVVAVQMVPALVAAFGWSRVACELLEPSTLRPAVMAQEALKVLGERPGGQDRAGDPAELVALVLRFAGPLRGDALTSGLGLPAEAVAAALERLADEGRVVIDELTAGSSGPEICDVDNLERLLRLARRDLRPALEPQPLAAYPAFLAAWQGLGGGEDGVDGLAAVLERLLGYPASAAAWEADILPARLPGYHPAWLDAVLAEGGVQWVGCGRERLTFHPVGERELVVDASPETSRAVMELFPLEAARFAFEDLAVQSGVPTGVLARRLWDAVWCGEVGNDGFAAVRRGLEHGFAVKGVSSGTAAGLSRHRPPLGSWSASRPFAGLWYRLVPVLPARDALAADELARDRVRLLLDRYGVLFRELLERELPALSWARVFRALRLMELSGEVVAGELFSGVPGLQFASRAALRVLQGGLSSDRVVWMCASDPASPCGLALPGLPAGLPKRVATAYLVLHGRELVVRAERSAKRLTIRVEPDHERLPEYLGFLKALLGRAVRPPKALLVEEVNGVPAAASPYRYVLEGLAHVVSDGRAVRLMRRYPPAPGG